MTRDELFKRSWKANTVIIYKPPRYKTGFEMLLQAVDFDSELMTLWPVDTSMYKAEDIVVNTKFCEVAPKPMQVVKIKK